MHARAAAFMCTCACIGDSSSRISRSHTAAHGGVEEEEAEVVVLAGGAADGDVELASNGTGSVAYACSMSLCGTSEGWHGAHIPVNPLTTVLP